jgi:hypothetical protein
MMTTQVTKQMTYKERSALSLKHYRPANLDMAVNCDKLRKQLVNGTHIPKDMNEWRYDVYVPMRHGGTVIANVLIKSSKSIGDKKCRGGRGHRLFIQCPACASEAISNPIPVGRLHQHYGYKHSK